MSEADTAERSDIISVDNTNFQAFVDEKMNGPAPSPEEAAAAELVKVEAERAERLAAEKAAEDPTHDLGEDVPKEKKGRINERFSELTEKRKAAEEAAETARQEARTARETAEASAREIAELKAKYEAPKTVPSAEPLPEQFSDVKEFVKARDEWVADQTRTKDAAAAEAKRQTDEREGHLKRWNAREKEIEKEIPDFAEKIEASTGIVKCSDQLIDAMIESDYGQELRYYLATNPDEATKIGKMTVAGMLKEVGRLEKGFEIAKKGAPAAPKLKVVEISKAPPPITPLHGGDAPMGTLKGTDAVPKEMNYDTWAALYRAGKIK